MMDWKQNGYLLCPKVMVQQKEKDQQLDGQMKEDLLKVGLFWDVKWTDVVVPGCSFD
jgi:hypothetical protein